MRKNVVPESLQNTHKDIAELLSASQELSSVLFHYMIQHIGDKEPRIVSLYSSQDIEGTKKAGKYVGNVHAQISGVTLDEVQAICDDWSTTPDMLENINIMKDCGMEYECRCEAVGNDVLFIVGAEYKGKE